MTSMTQIKYYIEVAKCLSFSKAAQHLYITQPTLSRQMTTLEEELNMQLFIRSKKGLKLTPAGIVLYKEFEQLAEQYAESVKKAEQASRGYSDILYVGLVNGMFIDELISEMIQYFKEKHPNIQIYLMRCTYAEVLAKLASDELDLIVSFDYHLMNQKNIKTKPLISYYPAWLVPKSNPLAKKDEITFKDMVNEDILVVQDQGWQDGHDNIIEFCKRYGGFYPNFFYVKDMDNLLMWLDTYDKCAFLNSKIKISDRVKMFPVKELADQEHHLTYAWRDSNKKYALNLLLNYFSSIDPQ